MGCLPRSACLGSLSLTQSQHSLFLGECLETRDNHLCSQQHVGNVEQNDDTDSDLDDLFAYDSESEKSDTASVDHLSDGEEEFYDARTRKPYRHNHCILCKKPRHNQRACRSKPEGTESVGQVYATGEIVSASVGKVTATGKIVCASGGNVIASGGKVTARGRNVCARGGKVSVRGGKVTARGGIVTESEGNVTARGGKVTASGGKVTTRGRKVTAMGGKVIARGGKVSATPSKPSASSCTPHPGFEMSTPDTTSSVVRTSGGAIKLKEGVWIRSPEKESRGRWDGSKSRMYPGGIRPFGFGVSWDPINGQTMLGNSMGLFRHVWPEGITPQDCIIHAATQSEIALSQSVGISLYVTTLMKLPFVIILSYTRSRLDD
nr:hypothetical protein [Tanacetum cinerariifolium]